MLDDAPEPEGMTAELPLPAGETEITLDRDGEAAEGERPVIEAFLPPNGPPREDTTRGELPRFEDAGPGSCGLGRVLAAQVEAAIDGILIVDERGEVVLANQGFLEVWGFPEDTIRTGPDALLLQMAVGKLVDPEAFLANVEWLYRHPEEKSRDEVALKDGRVLDRYSAPIYVPDGGHVGRVWFFHDVTRRARAEADLLESRQSLEAIINTIADPVFVKDAEHRFTLANDAFCSLIGMPRDVLLRAGPIGRMLPKEMDRLEEQDERVIATGVPDVSDSEVTHGDGAPHTVSSKKTRYIDSAGRRFVVGVIRDVTEQACARRSQHRAQQRTQALLELFRLPRTSEAAVVAFALDRLVTLTESGLGFIGFVDPTEATVAAYAWSARALQKCAMEDGPTRFDVRAGGLWAAPVRQHQVVIVNDYAAPHPLKTGCPAGHVELTRYLGVPLIKDGRVVLVAGLGNKAEDYGEADEVEATVFLEGLWELIGRGRAEQGLTLSRLQFNDVSAMVRVGGWELELATKTLRWTKETCRIHEVPESESFDLAKAILFYDVPGRSTLEDSVRRCMEDAEPFDLLLPLTSAKGTPLWVRAMGHAVEADGKVVRLAGTFQDVTARKQGEERLSRLAAAVEQSADDSILIDLEGRIQYVNPAFERTTGYLAEAAVGRDVNDLLCRDLDAALIPTIWESIRSGHPWKGRFSNRTKDGRVILLDGSVSAIRGLSGAIIGYVSARRDVTKQVELEARLSQAGNLEAIGTLAGGIAHDFNNILSAIVGNTQLARMKCADDAPVQHDLEVILQGARRATDLIKQILTFSRNARHEEGLVQVGLIVSEVSALVRATVPATIEIRTDIQSTSLVLAAPATIHRAILNLCTNALLAMNEREGLLEIGLEDVELDTPFARRFPGVTPGSFLRLWVRATGRGMDRDVAEHAFEPFYTTRDVGKGTGMGLAVVHGIVMSLHGAITVESEVDKGTTFEVYLSVARAAVPGAVAPPEELCRGTERVLVVDDDPLVLETIADMLRELGYRVRSETSGAAAQAAFEEDPQALDLVITDMTMPGIAGGALAAWLKDRRPDLPVIACSGYTEEHVPEGTSVHGIDEFLMKPLFMDTLAQFLRKVLDGPGPRTRVSGPDGGLAEDPSAAPAA